MTTKVKAVGARIGIKTKGFNVLRKLEALFVLSMIVGWYIEESIVVVGRRRFITYSKRSGRSKLEGG